MNWSAKQVKNRTPKKQSEVDAAVANTSINAREAILTRVREKLAKHIDPIVLAPAQPSDAPAYALPLPGVTPAMCFAAALEKVGGHPHGAKDGAAACQILLDLVAARRVQHVVLVDAPLLREIGVLATLQRAGVEVLVISPDDNGTQELTPTQRASLRSTITAANLCVSSAEHAIAESGTLVLYARRSFPRTAPMLPPAHVAFVRESQIVPNLAGLIPQLRSELKGDGSLWGTSCLMFNTGPSRTADIEQTLTIGVHGPGDMDVIMVADKNPEV